MKVIKTLLIFLVSLFLFATGAHAQENASFQEEVLEGEVVQIIDEGEIIEGGQKSAYQTLSVLITHGSIEGSTITIETGAFQIAGTRQYEVGNKILVTYTKTPGGDTFFTISDFVRREGLLYLAILFVLLAILIGGKWGAFSIIGMAFSFLVIFKFILPQILLGQDAVVMSILGSIVIVPVTFGLSHGISKKTLVAVIGTITTLVLVGVLASFFVDLTHLTGFASEEAGFLQLDLGNVINMKGLLLAGIIIASLGILDDITISQASVVQEISLANKKLKAGELFTRAMRVGKDHISSLVNTLILVYTGASLPLFLLFVNNPRPFSEVINYEIVADEIVRTLVGSMGIILAVPITTALAAYYLKSSGARAKKS